MTKVASADQALTLQLKWAEMASRNRLEAAIRPWRLSSGQLLLLRTLQDVGSATGAELARLLHLTPQSMSTLIKPLEDRELIDRATDQQHKRRILLSISRKGAELLTQLRPTTSAVDIETSSAFSPTELHQLMTLLSRIAVAPQKND